jgi:hypothetical protein
MEELTLREIFSSPSYQTDYAKAKAKNTCIRCGGYVGTFRDISSKLEYMVSALCQRCQDKCLRLIERGVS